MKIIKFDIQQDTIVLPEGELVYRRVTPIFGNDAAVTIPEGACFLYEDYSAQLKPGDIFYEIAKVEVKPEFRRMGFGTRLMNMFFEKCKPDSVVLKAGIIDKQLYDKLCEDDQLPEYIYTNIVPFYEKFGFVDVNNTTFSFQEIVPMLWPKAAADEAKRLSEQFARAMRPYQFENLTKDANTLMVVMRMCGNKYEEWFNENFPHGAFDADEVLKKLLS